MTARIAFTSLPAGAVVARALSERLATWKRPAVLT
jgi:hypothetical protein